MVSGGSHSSVAPAPTLTLSLCVAGASSVRYHLVAPGIVISTLRACVQLDVDRQRVVARRCRPADAGSACDRRRGLRGTATSARSAGRVCARRVSVVRAPANAYSSCRRACQPSRAGAASLHPSRLKLPPPAFIRSYFHKQTLYRWHCRRCDRCCLTVPSRCVFIVSRFALRPQLVRA